MSSRCAELLNICHDADTTCAIGLATLPFINETPEIRSLITTKAIAVELQANRQRASAASAVVADMDTLVLAEIVPEE